MPIGVGSQCSGPTPSSNPLPIDQAFICIMAANPEPNDGITVLNAKSSICEPNTHRSILANLLEVQRRMVGILFQKFVVLVGDLLDCGRKPLITIPECRCRVMNHSGLVWPLRNSRRAVSASESSFPVDASFSICASQRSPSKRINHSRNSASSLGQLRDLLL